MIYLVTLHLARTAAYPEGHSGCGYEIHAPLDARLHLDAKAWRRNRRRCRVRRFWTGEADRYGWLVHRAGGAGGATWCIDYDDTGSADNEPGYRLDGHRFAAGDYISIKGADGQLLPYRVAALRRKTVRRRARPPAFHLTAAPAHLSGARLSG